MSRTINETIGSRCARIYAFWTRAADDLQKLKDMKRKMEGEVVTLERLIKDKQLEILQAGHAIANADKRVGELSEEYRLERDELQRNPHKVYNVVATWED